MPDMHSSKHNGVYVSTAPRADRENVAVPGGAWSTNQTRALSISRSLCTRCNVDDGRIQFECKPNYTNLCVIITLRRDLLFVWLQNQYVRTICFKLICFCNPVWSCLSLSCGCYYTHVASGIELRPCEHEHAIPITVTHVAFWYYQNMV